MELTEPAKLPSVPVKVGVDQLAVITKKGNDRIIR